MLSKLLNMGIRGANYDEKKISLTACESKCYGNYQMILLDKNSEK